MNHSKVLNLLDGDKPIISVFGDCQWSSRSNGHRYKARGGCAVLIGENTKNIIYLGCKVKKFNYEGTSTGMESMIIKEGFEEIYKQGAVITKYIADA